MTTENGTALVPAPSADAAMAQINQHPMVRVVQQLGILWANVPLNSPEGQLLLEALTIETTVIKTARFSRPWNVVAALVTEPRGSDPVTGEVYASPRTLLLTDDGETLMFASPFVADTLAVLSMDRPGGVWNPPLRVEAVELPCRNGHDRTVLRRPKGEPAPAQKKGGKHG